MADNPAPPQKEYWGGLAFLVVLIGLLIYAGFWVNDWLEDEQQAPVRYVQFSGDRTHLVDAELEALIRYKHPGSFFTLNVDEVHQLLEQQPWVYRASVRKQWPNTLKVYLVEQQPAAQWNGDMLLNQYGDSFQAQLDGSQLPVLFGPGGSELTALQGYKAMQTLLSTAGLAIDELALSERFAWRVKLDNGIRLNLGRSEFIDRLQRFVDVYPMLQKQPKAVDYVDLRYDTGLAVGWLEDNNDSAT